MFLRPILFRRRAPFACAVVTLFALLSSAPFVGAAERIVSTDAAATELLVAMGLGPHIVAVDVTSQPPRPGVARVGYHRNLSAEGLLSLQPDLVVGSDHMGPPVVVTALQQARIPTLQLPSPTTAAQLADNIQRLGQAVSADPAALLAKLQQQLQRLTQTPLDQERMVFLLAMDASKLRVAGQGSGGQAFIELMGAQNAASHTNYQTLSDESLLALEPTTLLIASGDQASFDALLAQHPLLAHTPAGKQQRLLRVDASALVAGLSLAAVAQAEQIHRQLLAD
ncbi:heme/hemin ABC transporter substrate-binding protein [Simiduia agarivorans]|uniref:Periplasmic hemin-binding protein n=1 Tax=Simiduia agarivorans (strain DSM 21679 / JCM 13881 / BCRC 17597 / SA1) TaxID=1117647 RepID=K4KQG8_SIMAS|nr:ABC transporter substrate-binding protein [Simiduia agarivorans]AFV00364.1 Periplasmic hemin-binding protein [Simiduia agarivorans SA1 = DSM 21679]